MDKHLIQMILAFGIPSLQIFIIVGMMAGSESVGGVHFNDFGGFSTQLKN